MKMLSPSLGLHSSAKYSNCLHRGVSGLQAEAIVLNSKVDGSFLVRESESIQNGYTLCVLSNKKVYQYRILPDNNGFLSVESDEGVRNKKHADLNSLISDYVERGQKNGLVTSLTFPIMVSTEACSDDDLDCDADDLDNGESFERSQTCQKSLLCLKSADFDSFVQQYFMQRFNHIVSSSCDDALKESMRNYVLNGSIKDVYLNDLNGNSDSNNNSNKLGNTDINKCLHLQSYIEAQSQQLMMQVECFLKQVDTWRQLFGPMTTSPLHRQSVDAGKLSLEDLLAKMASCKIAISNLDKKASAKYKELIKMWKEGGVVVNDDQLASSTPLISSLSTAFSFPSPQLNLPVIPSASFDVRTVTSLGSLSKLLLTVDMMAGNLHALKSTKDAITKKNIFSHDKIEQLVKSTTCNTRLDMFVNGMKKKTYVFDDARQRETFCQLIQQLKRKHSSDVDVNYVSIFIGSWNMGSEIPMFCLQPWLRSDGLGKKRSKTLGMIGHDIYVVGTQESSLSDKEWSNRILSLLMESFGEEYYVVLIASLWSIRTLIIAKSKHKKKISNVQQSTVKTGIANALGNKGAMGVSLHFGGTSFCFINAHLTSGGEKMKRRNDNVKDISRFLDMGMKYGKDVTNKFHHVFFFGDLNYRLDQLDPQTIAESVKNADGNYQQLLEHDQLKQCINNKEVFTQFQEEEILFPPTYRYMKGSTDCYVWEKKKATGVRINVPSWCDRVLWKSYPYFWITNTSYGCCNNVCSSDHKPVFSSFDVKINNMKPSFTLNSNNNVGQLLVSFQFINLQLKCSRADILKVEIASTCIEGSVATKPSLCKVENDCNLNYQWNSDQIPLLSPIIDDLEQLEEQHLLLSVYNDALESLGECVIALKSGFDASPQLVEAELVYLGQSAGTLKCSLHIIVKDETNMQAFAKRRKPSVDLIYIDADFLQKHLNNRSTTSCIYADFLPPTQPNQPNKTSANVHKLHQGVHSFDSENKTKPPVLPRRKKT